MNTNTQQFLLGEISTEKLLGKADLCAELGWSRPRLDARLREDPKFPITQIGNRGGGWLFDLAAVLSYLRSADDDPRSRAPIARPVADMEGKKPVVEHAGETTAKHRRELIQTALLADKLKANRGQLLDAENVRARLGMALAEHGRWLDGLPDVLVRDGGLPDEITPQLRHAIDVERAKFFGAMKAALSVA